MVRLISYSQPAKEFAEKNPELKTVQDLIAHAARVSNPANQNNVDTSERLLKYLMKHAHWSPFEMASACMEITTTRDIARQILRHRSFSFQEFSQRYADPHESLSYVMRQPRMQDPKNRQNSIDECPSDIRKSWARHQMAVREAAQEAYKWATDNGIAKEQARAVLPEGLVESRIYMNGTLRSWLHYVELRSAHGTQKEHQEIARKCGSILVSILPMMEGFIHGEEG